MPAYSLVLKFNPHHDPKTGEFTSGSGGKMRLQSPAPKDRHAGELKGMSQVSPLPQRTPGREPHRDPSTGNYDNEPDLEYHRKMAEHLFSELKNQKPKIKSSSTTGKLSAKQIETLKKHKSVEPEPRPLPTGLTHTPPEVVAAWQTITKEIKRRESTGRTDPKKYKHNPTTGSLNESGQPTQRSSFS